MLDEFQRRRRRLFRADFTMMGYDGRHRGGHVPGARAVSLGRRLRGAGRSPHDRRAGRVQLAGRARQRADPHPADAVGQPAACPRAARSSRRRLRARAGAGRRRLARCGRCASWPAASRFATSASATADPKRRPSSRTSRSTSRPARSWRSSAAAARARRRWSSAWRDCSSRPRARSCSTAST